MKSGQTTLSVQRYLVELAETKSPTAGAPVVRALLERSADRLHLLCRSMLHKNYPRLLRGPLNLESEDLLTGVAERLMKALREIHPETTRQYFALAYQHLRWELNELSRRLENRMTELELHDSRQATADCEVEAGSPARLSSILDAIDRLPEEEREAFNLVRVQGVTLNEAAGIVGVSLSTIKRRVHRSIASLADMLDVQQLTPRESRA